MAVEMSGIRNKKMVIDASSAHPFLRTKQIFFIFCFLVYFSWFTDDLRLLNAYGHPIPCTIQGMDKSGCSCILQVLLGIYYKLIFCPWASNNGTS